MNTEGKRILRPDHQMERLFIPEGCPVELLDRAWWVNRTNPNCPLGRFIGNDGTVNSMARAAYVAMGRDNHLCNDQKFLLVGPTSSGKTTLARLFAETLKLPFVEVCPAEVTCLNDVLVRMAHVCETYLVDIGEVLISFDLVPGPPPLEVPMDPGQRYVVPPPLILFLDDVHGLPAEIVAGLLTGMDHFLDTGPFMVNCLNVCWMAATRDVDSLPVGLANRFVPLHLKASTVYETACIVRLNNPDLPKAVCRLVALYRPVPRDALRMVKEMRVEAEMRPGDWVEIARRVGEEMG